MDYHHHILMNPYFLNNYYQIYFTGYFQMVSEPLKDKHSSLLQK